MLFGWFGKNNDEAIAVYVKAMTGAVEAGTLEEQLENLIHLAHEKKLSDKDLRKAQEQVLSDVFDLFCKGGMLSDEDFSDYKELLDACYMVGEKKKYEYTTIAKRCNALYKIQEKRLLPTMNREYANIRYADDERLHFAAAAELLSWKQGEAPLVKGARIAGGVPYKAGKLSFGKFSDGWKREDTGVFWITSDRAGFHSGKKDVDIPLEEIKSITIGEGVLQLVSPGGITSVKINDYDMAGAIFSNLIA